MPDGMAFVRGFGFRASPLHGHMWGVEEGGHAVRLSTPDAVRGKSLLNYYGHMLIIKKWRGPRSPDASNASLMLHISSPGEFR
jgi:hypothetical protein